MNGATVSVEADGNRRKDRRAVALRPAVERLLDMFEAGLHRDPAAWKKRELRGMAREAFQRRKTVESGDLANGVHAGVKVERREARSALADFCNAQPHFASQLRE